MPRTLDFNYSLLRKPVKSCTQRYNHHRHSLKNHILWTQNIVLFPPPTPSLSIYNGYHMCIIKLPFFFFCFPFFVSSNVHLKHKCSKANYITKGKITEDRHIKQKVLAIALSLIANVKLFQSKMLQVPLTFNKM